MTSFIAACGSGRSTSFIPAVPAAWSVTTIAFIVRLPVSSSRLLADWENEQASLLRRCHPHAAVADGPMLPQRRQPTDPPSTLTCCHLWLQDRRFGARFWGQVRGFSGRSGSFKEMVLQAEKPAELQGMRATTRVLGIR